MPKYMTPERQWRFVATGETFTWLPHLQQWRNNLSGLTWTPVLFEAMYRQYEPAQWELINA